MNLLKWNKEFAIDQAADDQELLQELIDIFKTSFAGDLQVIREGISANDFAQVSGAAHSIKGASSSLGFEGVSEIAKLLEDHCKKGSIEQAGSLLPTLELMLREVEAL